MDCAKYVDLFLGNGETDRIFEDGLASKWFYIKALCGNTIPHATLPFGKMSVGAYSGGYPTGYGMHYPNSCGGIQKLGDKHLVRGFSHLHQSGTGAIRYYYNYAITSPFYGDITASQEYHELLDEKAKPGYYSARINDILCELTVDGGVAYHRYTFGDKNGRVALDFSNNGLSKIFGDRHSSKVEEPQIILYENGDASFQGIFSGIKLYFYVSVMGKSKQAKLFEGSTEIDNNEHSPIEAPYGVVYDLIDNSVEVKLAYSTISIDCAKAEIDGAVAPFDAVCENAYQIWNEHLSTIEIETDDEEIKAKFYSNFYHSLLKPCDMSGENILSVKGDVVSDFATFWDQYKTGLPLIFLCFPSFGDKIVKSILNISRTLQKIPCSFGLSNLFPCEEQAKMLAILTLCDGYYMGVPSATEESICECILRELSREDFQGFLKNGYFERYTHILDVTDACLCVADIIQNDELKARLLSLAKNWKNAYDTSGLMSSDSQYYEGDRYTYSFRIQKNMEERVQLAGGKVAFAKMLDTFFGFNGESVKQLTHIGAFEEISRSQYHRFEGFNNECDMETPYAYIYADCHVRLCEILHECVTRSFGLGRGGLPGNNDSGGLSSLFVWNVLGIFPVSGSGEFLIGSPHIDKARVRLLNGNFLEISVERDEKSSIYLKRVLWNGMELSSYKISARDLLCGGELKFYMKS